jgi:hypothetical protein
MKLRVFRLALAVVSLALAAACAPHAAAQTLQTLPPTEIVLPSEMVAGEPTTLSVLDATGHLSPHASVTLSNGAQVQTNALGRGEFTAPEMPGTVFAHLTATPSVVAVSIVLAHFVPTRIAVDWAPEFASIPDRFEIRGTGFHGDAAGNNVLFNQAPAFVLASSPVSMVILLPADTKPGAGELIAGEHLEGPPTIVIAMAVELDIDSQGLVAGAKANLRLRVRGTEQAQDLQVENMAPNVLKFAHGSEAFAHTSGGKENSANIEVEAIRGGDFSFHVRILQNDGSSANNVAAREFLLAARALASSGMAHRLDPIISKLEHTDFDARPLLKQLDKLASETNNDRIQVLFTAARNALMGR